MVVALNILLNLILRVFLGANGLALATSIAGATGMVILLLALKRRFGRLGFRHLLADLVKIIAATLACGAVCALLNRALPEAMGTGRVFVRLALCAGASLVAYAACCLALRVRTFTDFVQSIISRRRN